MPAPTLDATPSGVASNSYLTVAEGDTYFSARLYSDAWVGASVDTKTVALIMATRLIDEMYDWTSWTTHPKTQALQWPRISMLQRNRLSFVDNEVIPQELKNATAELAQALIVSERTAQSDIADQKIEALTAGPVSLKFGAGVVPVVIPDIVYYSIPEWWGYVKGRAKGTRELIRA
jgi:hypothetical protein